MLKCFTFVPLIVFLLIFWVWGRFCDEKIGVDGIIKEYLGSGKIDLSELYKLNASDHVSVADELISRYLNSHNWLMIRFTILPPYFTRVPDCFRRLNDFGSIWISVELSPISNNISQESAQNGVNEFIESISHLWNVRELYLYRMKLVECPVGISKLKSLECLGMAWNNLHSGSFDGVQLPNLERLSIYNNFNLRDFPKGVLNFAKLKRLSLNYCSLKSISTSISRLRNLKMLSLRGNQLKGFPREVHSLKSLEMLVMSGMGLMKSVEIDFVLNPRLKRINLRRCHDLEVILLHISEKCLTIEVLDIKQSPVRELIVSPNLAFSKIDWFECDLPPCLPPSFGDQLGWPEVIELCEVHFPSTRHCISGERQVLDRCGLSKYNRFYWKPKLFKLCVFDLGKEELGKDSLVSLWNMVVDMVEIDTSGTGKLNYEFSLIYLRNLYGESVEDTESIIKFTYLQYKSAMKTLLSALYKKIRNSNLDRSILKRYVESILEMFQRQQGEQLVYFYHLLKSLSKEEGEEVRLEEFIQNSVAILKDYVFTMTVNLKGCDQELLDECKTRAKNLGLIPDKEVINFERDDEYYKGEMLPLFYYKFSPDWFCKIVAGVIKFDEELKRQSARCISEGVEDPTIYFECEDVAGSMFPGNVKGEGVSSILMRMGLIGRN